MRINRDNYESYLVDYSDGVLSAKLMQEVENFLMLNPDIKEEFEMFTGELIETVNMSFSDKEALKKIPFQETSSSSEYFQQLCVAHIEGILSDNERIFLEKLVNDDILKQKELAAFEKTKLIIESANFNEKILLKQPEIIHVVTEANFEEYCIACMEGWLDQAGLVELNNYIEQHPNQKRVLNIYYKTRLTPDLSIVYPNKRKIKRFTVLTPNFKKYVSIASSVAAALVLGFMVFYTTTLDDKTQLSGNVSTPFIENTAETKTIDELIKPELKEVVASKKEKSILHDPFGFEKISGKELTSSNEKLNERYVINPMQPIHFNEIECSPCKQALEDKSLARADFANSITNASAKKASIPKKNVENSSENPAWVLAQAGITRFNKITKSELKVEKNYEENKTKIAFNSKFFAFSTQVNTNN